MFYKLYIIVINPDLPVTQKLTTKVLSRTSDWIEENTLYDLDAELTDQLDGFVIARSV